MTPVPSTCSLPRILLPVWELSDPASRCRRRCDALGEDTLHRRIATHRGDYWICSQTGQFVRDEFPKNLGDLYDGAYEDEASETLSAKKRRRITSLLVQLERYRQTGRLLEIGCGSGEILRIAGARGWTAEGNEVSPAAAESARRNSGSTVHLGPAEEIALERGAYDAILANNVFEHFLQPALVLEKLSGALRPGGVLYLQTINGASLSLARHPHDWYYYDVGHLYVPTVASLRIYFQRSGLRVLRERTFGFRSDMTDKFAARSRFNKLRDRWRSSFATMAKLGHRVRYLVQSVESPIPGRQPPASEPGERGLP